VSPVAIFRACAAMEERIFMGDWTFWGILAGLAGGPHPLVRMDPASMIDADVKRGLPAGTVTLTAAGHDVLAGRADQVALNGIDRWMGGVYLSPDRLWRQPLPCGPPQVS